MEMYPYTLNQNLLNAVSFNIFNMSQPIKPLYFIKYEHYNKVIKMCFGVGVGGGGGEQLAHFHICFPFQWKSTLKEKEFIFSEANSFL